MERHETSTLIVEQEPERPARTAAAAAEGDALRGQGRHGEARARFAEALQLDPDSAELHFKLATCCWVLGERDQTYGHLTEAIRLDPRLASAHEWLGQWYLQEGIVERALVHSARARELSPEDRGFATSHALALEAAGELDQAWELLQELLRANYLPSRVAALYGRMARRHGRQQDALELVLRLLSTGGHAARQEASLHFTAADLLDAVGRYDDAFAHATAANQLVRPPYSPATTEHGIDALIAYFTRDRIGKLAKASYVSDKPVLIVGMPRSGTSLVEQILASHPLVYGAGELDFLHRIGTGLIQMLGARPEEYPACLDRLTIDQADGLAQVYIDPLAAMDPAARRVTDKMPLNFMHLGLVALLLPQARVIHCRRDPRDTCLSCYLTHFTAGHEFTHDLAHLGHAYRQYDRLMRHWKSMLDLPMLEVQYESLVADPELHARGMIEFLGLDWDERCLRFHETRRPVSTASIQQVRRPMYQSSVGRWRNYEKHLGQLVESIHHQGTKTRRIRTENEG